MKLERIRKIRIDRRLKQKDVAKILKISQSNYSRWENGKEVIPLNKLNILCDYFKVSMDYVFGITSENKWKKKSYLNNEVIGNRIQMFRKNNNITQQELAFF